MPTVSRIIKIRQSRQERERRFPWGKAGQVISLIISLLVVVTIGIGVWFYLDLVRNHPSINDLPRLIEPPNGSLFQPTRLYDRTGQQVILTLENPAAQGWNYLRVSEADQAGESRVSQHLIDAILSTFDPGFWHEPGYSLRGIVEGAHTTLAQRLVLSLLLENQPASLKRNIQERVLAMQLTAQFGREKVLEWYLNTARYGGYVYGADAAARVYLGKPAAQLSIADAALLTALADLPGLTPWTDAPQLRDRQVEVILGMQANRLISQEEAQAALRENIQVQPEQDVISLSPALTARVLHQLSTELPLEKLYRGGYKIITTLDYALQLQIACTVQLLSDHFLGITPVPDGKACEAASELPAVPAGIQNSSQGLSADVIVMDPQSGEILAWMSENRKALSPSLSPSHPAGTILSPFLYLTAFSRGMSPATLVWDVPEGSDLNLSKDQLALYHGPLRLRTAMVNDYAGAAANVLQQVGFENVLSTETKFGIDTELTQPTTGATLNELFSQPASLLDIVQAYAVLANQGVKAGQPGNSAAQGEGPGSLYANSVLQVDGLDGRVLLDWSGARLQPIVNSQLAYLITHVLSDNSARSSDQANPESVDVGRPAAVKTGITSDGKDTWTIGYIPQLTVGVWIGTSEDAGRLAPEVPAGLWHAVMVYASRQIPAQDFAKPDGISRVQVCDPSGMLVTPACPAAVEEVFIKGNEPTQADNLYHEFYVDRQTGLLATIFTPEEFVEKKVYMLPPAEMAQWAEAAEIPKPPDRYDEIDPTLQTSSEVRITQPKILAYVSGQVVLHGSALGNNFSYYRLQAGQGLYPHKWLQIGEDIHQAVQDGTLGTWNTTGLEGPYIVELIVVKQDQSMQRYYLPIEIDNTPPQVQILAPKENDPTGYQPGEAIVMQAEASDNQALERVEFYIDKELVSTIYEPPFVAVWRAQPGLHSLLVRGFDLAGNTSEVSRAFFVSK